ncbi:hypothetical protein [Streptomyces sp. NBC_00076]|uniref:hypothetical protein n=1 Tax=Streptomyces sp. NBC_00076 TaxID=2975642 RepID=UPI003245FCD3
MTDAADSESSPSGSAAPRKHAVWKWLAGVVAAVISGVLVAWLSGLLNDDGPSNPPSPTSKRYILPFAENGNLQPKYRAARKVQTGECPTNSVFSADPEALRCVTAGELFDPCWSHALTVACLRSPWDPEVTVISKVTAHAPPSSEKPKPEPWALEIKTPKGGVTLRCSFAGGATSTVANQRVNWRCQKGTGPLIGSAAGEPDRSTKPWTILYKEDDDAEVRQADILTVWY